MKKILCFGDSNVFGFNPLNGSRFAKNIRWTGILQNLCGENYRIIEAGCNNRTCFKDNPAGFEQTGYKVLSTLLDDDVDYVVVAIGINDLQFQYNTTKEEIQIGINNMLLCIKQIAPNSKILLLAPTVISGNILNSFFRAMFDESSIEKSKWLAEIYQNCASVHNCSFLNLNEIAKVSDIDGLHYAAKEHALIAEAVYEVIKEK